MRIILAGGSGFLGRALADHLARAGHAVTILSRGAGRAGTTGGAVTVRAWAPDGLAGAWADVVDGTDVVVNLAGESIGDGRWTPDRKEALLSSRVLATRSLVAAMAAASRPPRALVSASAQGYYGDRGDEELTEASAPGHDFLAGVCVAWEAEARKAEALARVVLIRTGIVLARDAGALPKMLLPFRLFGGGPIGSGRQWLPWIHRDDAAAAYVAAVHDDRYRGPINLVTDSVRNRDFSRALGAALHRPSWLPVPGLAVTAAVGELAEYLLHGRRVVPARLRELGFAWKRPVLAGALEAALAER